MKIQIGNFGNEIAQPAPRVNVPAGAFDSYSGLKQLGDTGMQILSSQAAEQRQQDQALERAKAANDSLDREIQTKEIAQQVDAELASGTLHYTEAEQEFKNRLGQIQAPDMNGLDPVTAENLNRSFKRSDAMAQAHVETAINRSKVAEFKGLTDTSLDQLGKLASMPGADVSGITAQVHSLDPLGVAAYGKNWPSKKQEFVDSAWNAHVTDQVTQSRNNMDALTQLEMDITKGQYQDKLDPDKRNTQLGRIMAYKTSLAQRNEAAAARADREAEKKLRVAKSEFETFQTMADKGTILDPNYIDRVMVATEGTPYQAGIEALTKQVKETGGLAAQPIAAQETNLQAVDQLIASRGRSPELDKRREQIVKVLDGSKKDLADNGLRAGLERGVIDSIAPVDISNPSAFANSIANRLQQAETVGMWAGRPVSPLDNNEADQLRNLIDILPAKEKAGAISTISGAVGPRASNAIAAQLDKKDRTLGLAFAMSGSMTPEGKHTSELILRGEAAIKDKTIKPDESAETGWKAEIATRTDGIFPDEVTAKATKDAAYFIMAGLEAQSGGDIEKAVELAVGGTIEKHNGKNIPIPYGMDKDAFDRRLETVKPEEISAQNPLPDGAKKSDGPGWDRRSNTVIAGGVSIPIDDFLKALPSQELMYAGTGRYAVLVRGRPVLNSAGTPIIIKAQ